MKITAKTNICMVIGDPVEHSLSPQMHNAGYKALHIEDQYVYVACHVDVNKIEDFINGVRAMKIRGISCTMPHKLAVMPFLDEIEEVAKKIGAVNTIVNENGKLIGYNTDWKGIATPLEKQTSLTNKIVALLGAGGAARAAAHAVTNKGAKLTIYNRTFSKADDLAKEFHGKAYSFEEIENVQFADIIINTTSVGLREKKETPLSKKYITDKQILFDIVYGEKTQLLKDAQEKGAKTISGNEMFLYQGYQQFKLYTGYNAPVEAMKEALL